MTLRYTIVSLEPRWYYEITKKYTEGRPALRKIAEGGHLLIEEESLIFKRIESGPFLNPTAGSTETDAEDSTP